MKIKQNNLLSGENIGLFLLNNKALVILVILGVCIGIYQPIFFTPYNLMNVVRQISIATVLGIGYTVVMTSGQFDLSIGTMLSFVGVVMAHLSLRMPLWAALLIGSVLGVVCGFINGFVSQHFHLNPFIVTLATQQVYKGGAYLISGNKPVTGLSDEFVFIGQGYIGGIPFPIIFMLICVIAISILMYRTKFGREVVAVGGNPEAARVSGINPMKVKIKVLALMGLFVAFSAMIMTGRVASAQPGAGAFMESDAITSVVMGGTAMAGGKPNVVGTLFGCMIVGVISNGMNLIGIDSNWQLVVKGLMVLIAIIIDVATENFVNRVNNRPKEMVK